MSDARVFVPAFQSGVGIDNEDVTTSLGVLKRQRVAVRRTAVTVLHLASQAHTVDSDSGALDVSALSEFAVDVDITAVAGTLPTIRFHVDRLGADSVWYQVWSSAMLTAVGRVSSSLGMGADGVARVSLGATARLRWDLDGTGPSFTFSASVIGK